MIGVLRNVHKLHGLTVSVVNALAAGVITAINPDALQTSLAVKGDLSLRRRTVASMWTSTATRYRDRPYSDEKPADPIELRIYRGADGHFTLYEDEGDNYNYENCQFATIPVIWHDSSRTLEFQARSGSFAC